MAACQDVQKWITSNILVPVSKAITEARQSCQEVGKWVDEQVTRPVESWISKTEQQCRNWPWPLSWLCEAVVIVIKVVEWVVETVAKWVVTLVCQIVTFIIGWIVELVVRVVSWVVTFVVCLFSDFGGAIKSLYDLWNIVIDLVADVFDFVGVLLDDVGGILDDLGRLIDSLASSLGWLGVVLGIVKGVIELVRRVVDIVRDIVKAVGDIVVGVLTLNPCSMLRGVADLGVGIGRVILEGAAPAVGAGVGAMAGGAPGALVGVIVGTGAKALGVLASGIRDSVVLRQLEDIATNAINAAFGAGSDRAMRAIASLNMRSRIFGLPFMPDARRMFLSSNSTVINLVTLHNSGAINLHGLAGYIGACSKLFNEVDGEVVYAGTDLRVSYSDIDTFLGSGPGSVSEFRVYPVKKSKFLDHLKLAQRKARFLGAQFNVPRVDEFECTNPAWLPLENAAGIVATQRALMASVFGRVAAVTDDLSTLPAAAHFHYVPDIRGKELFGLTSWMRPNGTLAVPAGVPDSIAMESGVTYRNCSPDYVFRYVLIHEMGHYLGLDHENGTRWLDEIMYSVGSGGSVSVSGVAEYLALGGEPRFTVGDANAAWRWFTGDGATALFP